MHDLVVADCTKRTVLPSTSLSSSSTFVTSTSVAAAVAYAMSTSFFGVWFFLFGGTTYHLPIKKKSRNPGWALVFSFF